MKTFVYILLVLFILFDVYMFIKTAEYAFCAFLRHQAPFVPSSHALRRAVSDVLCQYYPNARRVCEIGSGFGGLARYIARHNNMRCVGLENMPFCALVSHLGDMFCGRGRCRTVWCDAFEYLDNPENTFDVAVAFLGPDLTVRVAQYSQNFPVMISLDLALPGVQVAHVIDVPGGGWVKYKGKKYPHKLFVYEF